MADARLHIDNQNPVLANHHRGGYRAHQLRQVFVCHLLYRRLTDDHTLRKSSHRLTSPRRISDTSYNYSLSLRLDNSDRFLGRECKIQCAHIIVAHCEVGLPCFHYWRPTLSEKDEWSRIDHACLNLIPHK